MSLLYLERTEGPDVAPKKIFACADAIYFVVRAASPAKVWLLHKHRFFSFLSDIRPFVFFSGTQSRTRTETYSKFSYYVLLILCQILLYSVHASQCLSEKYLKRTSLVIDALCNYNPTGSWPPSHLLPSKFLSNFFPLLGLPMKRLAVAIQNFTARNLNI